jgi:hypothetical protein
MGIFSYNKARLQQKYSNDPANFAYGQEKPWEELDTTSKATSLFQQYSNTGKEMAVGMGKAITETGAAIGDVATRIGPLAGVKTVADVAGSMIYGKGSVSERYKQGIEESQAGKTYYEKVTGKDLTNQDGTINWEEGRRFIGRAMEGPTYFYAAAGKKAAEMATKGLLSRILTRTVSALPEAGINTALQAGEEGTTENIGQNFLANALLMSGISNVMGEIKLPKEILNDTLNNIESEVGKLTPEQKADVHDALKQGIKSDEIITNLKKVVNNEVTPDEVAKTINKNIEGQTSSNSISPDELSKKAKNSLENNQTGIKPGSLERAKKEIQSGNTPPVKVRTLEDGTTFIEDGRNHLQAAKDLGLKEYPIEDVTSHYQPQAPLQEGGLKVGDEIIVRGFGGSKYPVKIKKLPINGGKYQVETLADTAVSKKGTIVNTTLSGDTIAGRAEGINYSPEMKMSEIDDLLEKQKPLSQTPLQEGGKTAETVKVPKEQLPVGTGKEKVSRLEARMTNNLDKMTPEQIDSVGLSTYKQMNKAEQKAAAIDFVTKNPEDGIKILSGEMEPPKGILKNSIYVAMDSMAHEDADLARKLASLSSTRAGQEISMLTEINPDSPVSAMRDVSQARIQAAEKRLKSGSVSKTQAKAHTQYKEIRNKIIKTRETWNSFIEEIKCK